MSYRQLNDICISIADGDHQAPPKSSEGIPFITISCLDPSGRMLDYSQASYVPEEYYLSLPDYRRAREGDVLLSVVGSLGIPYLVKANDQFVFQRHIAILRPNNAILPEYLFYLLSSPACFHYIDSIAQGAAQRTFTLTQLRKMKVDVPPLSKQRETISILAPFDKLIENNQKQIKLLEEAAQRLYKDWFVDLKFPGYETTPIIDDLPEGWHFGMLKEIAEFRRGKIITAANVNEGSIPVVAGGLQPAYYHSKSNAQAPIITISGSGANAGFTRLYTENIWASDCSYVDSTMTDVLYFAYESVVYYGRGFAHLRRGSAQPHVYPSHINEMELILPPKILQDTYCKCVEPIFDKFRVLNIQTKFAQEARDRLLPKLMSGEIEVE